MIRAWPVALAVFFTYGAAQAIGASTEDANGDGRPDTFIYKTDAGKKERVEFDKNFDGKIDAWSYYLESGASFRSARDTNGDGRPDKWNYAVKGRDKALREEDRNFDGKVDRRVLSAWAFRKDIKSWGYAALYREDDDDFDGVIDFWREKKDPKVPPSPDRKGQKMEQHPRTDKSEPKKEAESVSLGQKAVEEKQEFQEMLEQSRSRSQ